MMTASRNYIACDTCNGFGVLFSQDACDGLLDARHVRPCGSCPAESYSDSLDAARALAARLLAETLRHDRSLSCASTTIVSVWDAEGRLYGSDAVSLHEHVPDGYEHASACVPPGGHIRVEDVTADAVALIPDPATERVHDLSAEADSLIAAGMFMILVRVAREYCDALGGDSLDAIDSMLAGLSENLHDGLDQ